MYNVPSEISQIFLDPTIQDVLAQVLTSALPSQPPMRPPTMEATMLISKEWEKWEMETSKAMEEEADEYHEHPEYEYQKIYRVVREEETVFSESLDEEEDVGGRTIVQNFNNYFKEEMAWQWRDDKEEAERSPPGEDRKEDDKVVENVELPTGEQHENVSPSYREEEDVEEVRWTDMSIEGGDVVTMA